MRDLIESYDFVSPLEEARDIIVQFASANPWITLLGILTLLFFFLWRRNLKIRRRLQKTLGSINTDFTEKTISSKKEVHYEKTVSFDGNEDSKNAYLTAIFTFKSQVPLDSIKVILQNSQHFLCSNNDDEDIEEKVVIITEYVKRYNTNVEVLELNKETGSIKFIFHTVYQCSNKCFDDCYDFDAVENDSEFVVNQLVALVEGLAQNVDDEQEAPESESASTSRWPPKPPASGGIATE